MVYETLEYQVSQKGGRNSVKKNMFLILAFTVVILAGGVYYFFREEPPEAPKQAATKTEDQSGDMNFAGSSLTEDQGGKRLYELSAEKITINQTTKIVRFYGVKGTFYQDNGSKVDLTAQEGVLDPATKTINLDGNVRAVSSEGAVFTAPKTRWDGLQHRFFGSGGITFTREDIVITGDTIESDGALEKVKVQGQTRALKGGMKQ